MHLGVGEAVYDDGQIIGHATESVQWYFRQPNVKPKPKTAYLQILSRETSQTLLVRAIGSENEWRGGKAEEYFARSGEKGSRLFRNLSLGHVSSYSSRDTMVGLHGGAICAGPYILSMAGITEVGDETVLVHLGLRLGWLNPLNAEVILYASNNPFTTILLQNLRAVA